MKHLIPMVDFVLNFDANKETINDENKAFRDVVFNYAKFLKQPLQLGMFVPCDEKGNVLVEPERYMFTTDFDYKEELHTYNEAKSKVLFEGFYEIEYDHKDFNKAVLGNNIYTFWRRKDTKEYVSSSGTETIECLSKLRCLPLTPTALKQIYG